MGGWCRHKIARLLCRPGPPARSGRRPAAPRSRSWRGARSRARQPQGRCAFRAALPPLPGPAPPSGRRRWAGSAIGVASRVCTDDSEDSSRWRRQSNPARSPRLGRGPRGRPRNLCGHSGGLRPHGSSTRAGVCRGSAASPRARLHAAKELGLPWHRVLTSEGPGGLSLSESLSKPYSSNNSVLSTS